MALTRDDAAEELVDMLGPTLTEAGIDHVLDVGGLRFPINEALRKLGVARSDLATAEVADADADGFLFLLEWAGLRHIRRYVLPRVSISKSDLGVSKQRQQFVEHLDTAIAEAWTLAAPFVNDGTTGFSQGTITLDTIEPYPGSFA